MTHERRLTAVAVMALVPLVAASTAQAQTQEWVQTSVNLGPGISIGVPRAQVVGSDPPTVYVTGLIETPDLGCFNTACQWGTVAYDAGSGQQVWGAIYPWLARSYNQPAAMALDADGRTLYITGVAETADHTNYDVATIGYDAGTGNLLWEARTPAWRFGTPIGGCCLAVDRGIVYVATTDHEGPAPNGRAFVTIAYDAVMGVELWRQRFTGDRLQGGGAVGQLTVDGMGGIYVTGSAGEGTFGPGRGSRYVTVKYTQDVP